MTRYEFAYNIESQMLPAIRSHFFKLRVLPQEDARQHIVECHLEVSPQTSLLHARDAFGNAVQYGGYDERHGHFSVRCTGIVDIEEDEFVNVDENEHALLKGELEVALYRYAGPLTGWNVALQRWARRHVDCRCGMGAAEALMHAVYCRLQYERFHTDNNTCATEVFRLQKGVCQDYAHLMIAACRSVGLCARYVNGLVEGEGETHAWVEVYDGRRWLGFDPTHDKRAICGYIKLAHGRDVSDCPTNRGRFYQWTNEQMAVSVSMKRI